MGRKTLSPLTQAGLRIEIPGNSQHMLPICLRGRQRHFHNIFDTFRHLKWTRAYQKKIIKNLFHFTVTAAADEWLSMKNRPSSSRAVM